MELLEAIRSRRAVRDFTAEPVERHAILELIDAAIQAPSAMNLQPWAFAVVRGRDTLNDYGQEAKEHLLSNLESYPEIASLRSMLTDKNFNMFYGAPALILICATPRSHQADEDCCLAAANLMLAARGQGLGTCWIGLSRPWLSLPATRARLELQETCGPVAPIIVGHPSKWPVPTPRNSPKVTWCA